MYGLRLILIFNSHFCEYQHSLPESHDEIINHLNSKGVGRTLKISFNSIF